MNLIDRNKIESNTRRFTDADTEFRFLLGGIGTGSISVGNRGQLCDWEIFNKPNQKHALSVHLLFPVLPL